MLTSSATEEPDPVTTTTAPAALYVHDDGRVACTAPRCIGAAATAVLERRPDAPLVQTSLGTWERFAGADLAEFGLECETCA